MITDLFVRNLLHLFPTMAVWVLCGLAWDMWAGQYRR